MKAAGFTSYAAFGRGMVTLQYGRGLLGIINNVTKNMFAALQYRWYLALAVVHFNGIAVRTDEGDRMAEAMGDKRILFLANHGVIVVGDTVAQAFDDCYYLERAAQVQVLAMQTGQPLNVMSDELARLTHEQFGSVTINADLHFTAMKEILDAEEPAYAS